MINTSNEYKSCIRNNRNFEVKLVITPTVGSPITLYKNNLRDFFFDSYTSNTNSFDIGAAVTGELSFTIDNLKGLYSEDVFEGCVIQAYIGVVLSETTEWINKGKFYEYDTVASGGLISITSLNAMNKFCVAYSESTLSYPATLFEIVQEACSSCGVTFGQASFDFGDYVVGLKPDVEKISYRDVLTYVGQIAGLFALIKNDALYLDWYDMSKLNILDGGDTSFTETDILDGGDASFSNTDILDGGSAEDLKSYFHIYAMKSASIRKYDVTITGIQVKAKGDDADYGETYLYGSSGYVIKVENILILPGQSEIIATHLGAKIVGMTFRPFSMTALSDPSIECGDVGFITDRKQNTYATVITNLKFTFNGYESFGCGADTPTNNSAAIFSEVSQLLDEAKKQTARQISTYDATVQQFTNLISNGFGVFKTDVTTENGGIITYTHDQPTMAESSVRWFHTSNGMLEQTNSGGVWTTVMGESLGHMLVKVLTAIGINAEWINVETEFNVNDNFIVDANGVCTADTFNSANANITGGSINIAATSAVYSYITMATALYNSKMAAGQFKVTSTGLGTSVDMQGHLLNINDIVGGNEIARTHLEPGVIALANTSGVCQAWLSADGTLTLANASGTSEARLAADGTLSYAKGRFTVGGGGYSESYMLYVVGSAYATGSFQSSDKNLKKSIKEMDLDFCRNFIMKLKPSSYEMKEDSTGLAMGFIAQDIESIVDKKMSICQRTVFRKSENDTGEERLALSYNDFIAPLVKVVQSQQTEIEDLKSRIEKLESLMKGSE